MVKKINKDAQRLGKLGGRPKTETAKHTLTLKPQTAKHQ